MREAQNLAAKHGGCFYFPYQHVSNPETLEKAYGKKRLKMAYERKKELDKDQVLVSGLYHKYLERDNNVDVTLFLEA